MIRTPYWSDYQSSKQFFSIMTFDPGDDVSVSYVDGDVSEWNGDDTVTENGGVSVSMKYDEKYLYFMIRKNGLDFENETFYIPIDTTQKTGSNYAEEFDLKFGRAADLLLVIDGADNSRLLVQERYEALRSTYSAEIYKFNTYETGSIPERDSPIFKSIDLILSKNEISVSTDGDLLPKTFETGKLTYGNANPESDDFNSLADLCAKGDCIEVKLPWQLLNFGDPSRMMIHDDYYDGNYGVEFIEIDGIYVGVTQGGSERVELDFFELEGWGNDVSFHERLKRSYYDVKGFWGGDAG